MKAVFKTWLIIGIFFIVPIFIFAQNPPHPNGGNAPGSGNVPVGGAAPIGSGFVILISLASGWGVKSVFDAKKRNKL